MSNVPALVFASLAGFALGSFYFAALWLTVRHLPDARRPALLTLGSLFIRVAVVLAGFYLVGAGHWERLVLALFGFVCARAVIARRLRPHANALPSGADGNPRTWS